MKYLHPADYLDLALTYIHQNAYFHINVADWQALKTQAMSMIQSAHTTADTYPAIKMALESLGDYHSGLVTPPTDEPPNSNTLSALPLPQGQRWAEDWGYIVLPHFGGSDEKAQRYAETGQQIIRDVGPVRGWIVDLRHNGGGNMWPMLVAIGPLAGEGVLGSFMDRTGREESWGYRGGTSFYGEDEPVYTVANPVPTIDVNIPIALLISNKTISSGEITLISFLGRPNIRTFGATATRGVPTSNSTFDLPDGAIIVLTTALTTDRTSKTYRTSIEPDVLVAAEDDPALAKSPVLMAALEWLQQVG